MKRSDFRRSDRYVALEYDRCGHCMVSIMSLIATVVASFFMYKNIVVLLNGTRCVQNYTGIFEKNKPCNI
jgi:hypothetical protein